jgi:hypothetical protein
MMNSSRSASPSAAESSSLPSVDAVVRIPFVHGCRVTTASRVRGGLMCNLSVQGAYVTLDEPLPAVGETVQLAVMLPGQEPIVQAEAVVACQNREAPTGPDSLPPGIGLRFTALPAPDRLRVEALIRQHHDPRNSFLQATPPHSGPRRVPFMHYGQLTTSEGTSRVLICNLSRLGAYVAANPIPAKGELVGLAFKAPEGTAVDVKAVVTWRSPEPSGTRGNPQPSGCGLRFVSLSKLDEVRLRAIVDAVPRTRRG